MGVYDTYGEQAGQLKVGDVSLHHFNVGDTVNIPDGVYLTYVNVIVILNGVFIAEFETLTTKWGEPVYPSDFSKRAWFENLVEIAEQLVIDNREPELVQHCHLYLCLRQEIEYQLRCMGFNISGVMAQIPVQAFWTALEAVTSSVSPVRSDNDAADRQS